MSSLLPVVTQALRPRADAVPERRGSDTPRESFAKSLASARVDDEACATPNAAAKARLAAQQRADLRALMLTGAMKFAITKHDAPPTSMALPGSAASLPATPATDGDGGVASDGTAIIVMSPMAVPEAEVGDVPVDGMAQAGIAPAPHPVSPSQDAIAVSLPDSAAIESLPDVPLSTETLLTAPSDIWPAIDPSAASAAAMQLVASLPLPPPPVSLPDMPDNTSSESDVVNDGLTTMRLDRFTASLPDRPSTDDTPVLVDDHFDAPASVLEDAPLSRGTTPVSITDRRTEVSARENANTVVASPSAGETSGAPTVAALPDRTRTDRGGAALDPAFRERLERVMERMQREFGHEVTVVETVRSQARQNALYAQGRTAPGPIVTWTRTSKHAQGRAADLMVDGAWENPLGYAHLAEVAKQEGLRTLGARDPGHVELPGEGGVSGDTLAALMHDLQGEQSEGTSQYRASVGPRANEDSHTATMARVANVAQVARVATVAAVARVATVARPGESGRDARPGSETTSPLAVSGMVPAAGATDLAGSVRIAAPPSSLSMADRISHLMDLQATQSARPLSSVMLRMENAGGLEDQIRIDTRGTSVDARLGLGNAQQAAALTDRLGELREALERRGLTADGVRVQSTSAIRATDSATFSRTAAPVIELAAMRAASDSQAQGNLRDQSTRDQQQREAFARDSSRHTPRPSSDDPRHRSRREQPEDRR